MTDFKTTNEPFDANAEPFKTMLNNGWIKLSERKPVDGQLCLVCIVDSYIKPHWRDNAFWSDENGFYNNQIRHMLDRVTHWAEYPDTPEFTEPPNE